MDPISYPKITIGEETLEVRFRQSDVIALLKDDGINILEPFTGPKIETVERNLKLLRRGLMHAHSYTVEELGDALDFGQVGEVDGVVGAAIKKAASQIMTAYQPAGPIAEEQSAPIPVQ